jgi:hypothetical protein
MVQIHRFNTSLHLVDEAWCEQIVPVLLVHLENTQGTDSVTPDIIDLPFGHLRGAF